MSCTRLLGRLPTVTSPRPWPPRRKSRQHKARVVPDVDPPDCLGSASADSYLLGSYRIATAPEPNSSRLTSFRSTCFDKPANNVGPWPASLGCTTNPYSSINPSSVNACGSFTPPTNSPLPGSCLSCSTAFPRSPRTSSAFQSTRSRVLDTTYFFAALEAATSWGTAGGPVSRAAGAAVKAPADRRG